MFSTVTSVQTQHSNEKKEVLDDDSLQDAISIERGKNLKKYPDMCGCKDCKQSMYTSSIEPVPSTQSIPPVRRESEALAWIPG